MKKMKEYYRTQDVVIFNGDCLDATDSLNETFDACISDPPYGTTSCSWDTIIPFAEMWALIWSHIKRDGTVCLFGSEPFSSMLRTSCLKYYKYDWIYKKQQGTGFLNAKKQPLRIYENISVFYKKQPFYTPQKIHLEEQKRKGVLTRKKQESLLDNCYRHLTHYPDWVDDKTRYPVNILEGMYDKERFDSSKEFKSGRLHPTQKPVTLLEYLIKTYTREKETVLDFCAGSGTTAVAALNTGRKCVLIEKEERYCEISAKRLQKYTPKMFDEP